MKNIAAALAKFRELVPDIKKESENPYFKSKYAALDSILPAIKKPLADSGLVFVQMPTTIGNDTTGLMTKLIHVESGETIEDVTPIVMKSQDPQAQGSAITYMRRYALVAMLALNTEDDDDGNAATQPKKKSVIDSEDQPFDTTLESAAPKVYSGGNRFKRTTDETK